MFSKNIGVDDGTDRADSFDNASSVSYRES
jgi:hypothetical protein